MLVQKEKTLHHNAEQHKEIQSKLEDENRKASARLVACGMGTTRPLQPGLKFCRDFRLAVAVPAEKKEAVAEPVKGRAARRQGRRLDCGWQEGGGWCRRRRWTRTEGRSWSYVLLDVGEEEVRGEEGVAHFPT
jgi:hypothetical protein